MLSRPGQPHLIALIRTPAPPALADFATGLTYELGRAVHRVDRWVLLLSPRDGARSTTGKSVCTDLHGHSMSRCAACGTIRFSRRAGHSEVECPPMIDNSVCHCLGAVGRFMCSRPGVPTLSAPSVERDGTSMGRIDDEWCSSGGADAALWAVLDCTR